MNINIGIDGDFQEAFNLLFRLLPIIIPVVIIDLTLKLAAFVSIARKPNPWGDKILWLLLAIIFNLFGAIIYFAIGSSHLEKIYAEQQDRRENQ
jgi:hypothetical protein